MKRWFVRWKTRRLAKPVSRELVSMGHQNELLIPPIAENDSGGVEIIRAWVAEKGLHVSLSPNVWKDPAAWGIALADVIRHLADAYKKSQDLNKEEVVQRILAGINAEIGSPTDEPTGDYV